MDDQRIIALYWDRDENAIPETKKKYGAFCHSIALRVLGSEPEAEECVNDTLFALWNAIPPAKPEPLSSYVGKIARNLALKRHRWENAGKRRGATVSFEELDRCIPAADTVEEALAGKELARVIDSFLRAQSREDRNLFLRRYWFFDSSGELARRFGMSSSQVKSRLLRLREKLKEYLKKELEIYVG